jgi:hypothetical protein
MTSESNTSRSSTTKPSTTKPSTSKAATSSEKKISPDHKRAELEMMMTHQFPLDFKRSNTVRYLYNGKGLTKGDKIQIRFDKTNFKVIVGKPSTAVILTSVPLGALKVQSVPGHIIHMLNTY